MAAAAQKKKVSVDFPDSLNRRIEVVVQEQHTSVSVFLRDAAEMYLRQVELQKLEDAFREGYAANEELALQVDREFSFVDAEVSALVHG